MTRPAKLTEAQARYVRKAVKLRRQFTAVRLAHKFGVSVNTITKYGRGQVKGRK